MYEIVRNASPATARQAQSLGKTRVFRADLRFELHCMIEIVTEISARLRRLACPSAGRSITDKNPDFSVTDKNFAGLGEIVRLQREPTDQLRPPLEITTDASR